MYVLENKTKAKNNVSLYIPVCSIMKILIFLIKNKIHAIKVDIVISSHVITAEINLNLFSGHDRRYAY